MSAHILSTIRPSSTNRDHRHTVVGAVLLTAMTLIAASASATTYTWNTGSGDWNTGSNWTPAGPPVNGGNTVNIDAPGETITNNPPTGDENWKYLNFAAGTIQDHDRMNANNTGTWQIGDGVGVTGSARFTFSAGGTIRGAIVNVNSDGIVETSGSSVLKMGHGSSALGDNTLNIKGGTVTVGSNIEGILRTSKINLSSGVLTIAGGITQNSTNGTFHLNVSGGSFTAGGALTVGGTWITKKSWAVTVTGDTASLIQFSQWNMPVSTGGTGTLTYVLEPGEALTPISLTHATAVFGNANATNFVNNFTLNIDGTNVTRTFVTDLVLFDIVNAPDFNGVSELKFTDNIGTSLRSADDVIQIAVADGIIEYKLKFDNLRPGNPDGDLEIWLKQRFAPRGTVITVH